MPRLNDASRRLLTAAFGKFVQQARIEWWKCLPGTKERDPATAGHGRGLEVEIPGDDYAVYYCVGRLKPGTGRANSNVVAVHALVIDDVGTKVDRERIDGALVVGLLPPVSYVVRSSEGNFQYGWLMPSGMAVEVFRGVREKMAWDFGANEAKDPARLVRLPQGVNGKDDAGRKSDRVELDAESPAEMAAHSEAGVVDGFGEAVVGSRTRSEGGGQKATFEDVKALLRAYPNPWTGEQDSGLRETWMAVLHGIKGALRDEDEIKARMLAEAWSGEDDDFERTWESIHTVTSAGLGALEIALKALPGAQPRAAATAFDDGTDVFGVPAGEWKRPLMVADFWAYMPMPNSFICEVDDAIWPAASVDAQVVSGKTDAKGKPVAASKVLRMTRPVHQRSWVPGGGRVLEGVKVAAGGIEVEPRWRVYNLYRPPLAVGGKGQATLPWTAHVAKMYPDDAEAILDWLAFKVQFPGVKVNHALVLGGVDGIGKDMMLGPVRDAVGAWNFKEAAPGALTGRFNQFAMSVVLRISEAHDLGEGQTRRKFYEITKTLIAAPPEVLPIDQKGIEVYAVPNVVGVIITTNYKHDLYLPKNDRRHYVAWSAKTASDMGGAAYFNGLAGWLEGGGRENVAAFLRERDLSRFNAKAPPRRTKAWKTIVSVSGGYEEEDAEDAFEALGKPEAVVWQDFVLKAGPRVTELLEKNNMRAVANIIDQSGYERFDNPANGRGRWRVLDMWIKIYVRKELAEREKVKAAEALHRRKITEAEKERGKF